MTPDEIPDKEDLLHLYKEIRKHGPALFARSICIPLVGHWNFRKEMLRKPERDFPNEPTYRIATARDVELAMDAAVAGAKINDRLLEAAKKILQHLIDMSWQPYMKSRIKELSCAISEAEEAKR